MVKQPEQNLGVRFARREDLDRRDSEPALDRADSIGGPEGILQKSFSY